MDSEDFLLVLLLSLQISYLVNDLVSSFELIYSFHILVLVDRVIRIKEVIVTSHNHLLRPPNVFHDKVLSNSLLRQKLCHVDKPVLDRSF